MEKFSEGTGDSLEANMKVLLLCKVNFQPKYGLSLIVEDIDPTYTLGDMAEKLEHIRQSLKQAGIFENNKKLVLPSDFFRIAVIAPKEAAGLGDFQEEAKKLRTADICDFQYFFATFQGADAPSSIMLALKEMLVAESIKPFDALVIIRGGGAVTDLAWLNDEALAKELCFCPIPIVTGIGHEKDNTILDEIANLRFGTPSKAIQCITSTIYQAAQQAINHISEITQTVKNTIIQDKEKLDNLLVQTRQALQTLLIATKNRLENYNEVTVLSAKSHLKMCWTEINNTYETIILGYPKILELTHENCKKNYHTIIDITKHSVKQSQHELINIWEKIHQDTHMHLKFIDQQLQSDKEATFDIVSNYINFFKQTLSQLIFQVEEKSQSNLKVIKVSLESIIKEIIGFGPEMILRRGYAITTSQEGKIITSTKEALTHSSLKLTFKDGSVHVNQPRLSEE